MITINNKSYKLVTEISTHGYTDDVGKTIEYETLVPCNNEFYDGIRINYSIEEEDGPWYVFDYIDHNGYGMPNVIGFDTSDKAKQYVSKLIEKYKKISSL